MIKVKKISKLIVRQKTKIASVHEFSDYPPLLQDRENSFLMVTYDFKIRGVIKKFVD